jgi:hypothetical protein
MCKLSNGICKVSEAKDQQGLFDGRMSEEAHRLEEIATDKSSDNPDQQGEHS